MVQKSLNIIEVTLSKQHIKVIKEYNSTKKIDIYENEIMHVVLNILKNAQDNFQEKNIKDPFIKIIIDYNKISFCDNGGGICENIIEKIFDPYFSAKDEKNGTGLGLYMAKVIVEDHHKGKMSVKNMDNGVCFTIEF